MNKKKKEVIDWYDLFVKFELDLDKLNEIVSHSEQNEHTKESF